MTHDSTPSFVYRLTEHRRFQCCVHEAGHAVAAALANRQCLELAVAPEGSEEWRPVTSRGRCLDASWGYCTSHPVPLPLAYLKWDPETTGFDLTTAKQAHVALLDSLGRPAFRAAYYRDLRATLCGSLAGEIAEGLLLGEEPCLESDSTEPDDINTAEAYCDLLPYRNVREFDHAVGQTTIALRNHWRAVMILAEALAQAGTLDEDAIRPYLPPSLKGWPTPPPRRRFA